MIFTGIDTCLTTRLDLISSRVRDDFDSVHDRKDVGRVNLDRHADYIAASNKRVAKGQ